MKRKIILIATLIVSTFIYSSCSTKRTVFQFAYKPRVQSELFPESMYVPREEGLYSVITFNESSKQYVWLYGNNDVSFKQFGKYTGDPFDTETFIKLLPDSGYGFDNFYKNLYVNYVVDEDDTSETPTRIPFIRAIRKDPYDESKDLYIYHTLLTTVKTDGFVY